MLRPRIFLQIRAPNYCTLPRERGILRFGACDAAASVSGFCALGSAFFLARHLTTPYRVRYNNEVRVACGLLGRKLPTRKGAISTPFSVALHAGTTEVVSGGLMPFRCVAEGFFRARNLEDVS